MESILMNNAYCIMFFVLVTILYNSVRKSKKKLPPGPPALPIIGHVHLLKDPLHQVLLKVSNQYGPAAFLRLGSRPVLVVSNYTLADQCFTTHDLAFANRVHLPTVKMAPDLILWANYGSYWRTVRQAAAHELLSNQQIQASSHIRAKEFRFMALQLFKLYESRKIKSEISNTSLEKLEFKKMLFESMMDLMLIIVAGRRFYGDNLDASDNIKKFGESIVAWFQASGPSNKEDYVPLLRILDLKGTMRKMKYATKMNEEMVQKMIDEHRQEGIGKRKTMINSLLELQKEDSDKYKDEVIGDIVITLMLGGTDTMSTTIEWAMAELLNDPEVLEKAKAEIDEHVGNTRLVQETDMDKLPYLKYIINEILRLHPAAPLLVPHESREEIKLAGYDIPKGTMLLVNVYTIQRDQELWEHPNKFNPERFEERTSNGKYIIPFGMGRRRCAGERLAMRTMEVLLGTLIQCFDWKRQGNELIDLTEGAGITIPLATPLEVMYQPRQVMKKMLSEL